MPAKYVDERLSLPVHYTPGKIGVVTVLYNSATVLKEFFESIERQQYTNFVVYCVDNASTDDSVDQCRSRGNQYIVIESGTNVGVAAGNNVGTRAAVADGCEFVLYLNNDVVFGPELFGQLVEGLRHYDCSMTTPLMYYHDRPEVIWAAGGYFQPWLGYRCLHFGHGETEVTQPQREAQVSYTPTCCVLVRREIFAEIGIMDERYFVYYDDTDFMLRAWKRGKKLYFLPHAKLWHKVSSLAGADSPFRQRYLTRNRALYTHKNVNPLGACLISALYCAYFPFMWLRRRITKEEAIKKMRYWIDGIRVAAKAVI
jgi:GT2 family glycosyltransferase